MDIQFYGANCLAITAANTRVIVDDTLADLGGKSVTKTGDIALFTGPHATPAAETKLVIDMPGEYEAGDISIYGIPARAHIDEAGQQTATMDKIIARDIRLLVGGHVYPALNDTQLERIGVVDIVAIPVGGNGFTLDSTGALGLLKKLEPKIVIPTYYADSTLTFPMPPQSLEAAHQGLSLEVSQTINKLRLKPGSFEEGMQLVVLEKN